MNGGQERMVRAFCLSGRVVQLGLAPAGAGKTTAMEAVVAAWGSSGRQVVPLAPSAAAAEVLSSELGVSADTVAKFDHDQPEIVAGTLILIDEAGLSGTLTLDRIVARAQAAGAVVRLIGDDQQLGAIEAGGVIRQIAHEVGAVRMEQVVRFADPAEARATLQIRNGHPAAADFYLTRNRVVAGTDEAIPEAAYEAWLADVRVGRHSALLASSSTEVSALNARARGDRVVAGLVTVEGTRLHDGNVAGAGDWIATRRNERLLAVHAGRDWVKNGDSWAVEQVHEDGALTVVHRGHRGRVTLPPEYVRSQVELDYARTIRRSQGLTVDRAHLVIDPRMKREDLYVGLSRARQSTHLYVAVMTDPGPDHHPDVAGSAADVLKTIIARTGIELSAGETIREAIASVDDLHRMAVEYEHALDVQTGDRYRIAAEHVHPGLSADLAWPNVVRRLHRAEAAGRTVEEVLDAAEHLSGWADSRCDTEVMAHRLDRLLHSTDPLRIEPEVPEWLAAAPPRRLPSPWDAYLPERYAEMAGRISQLATEAVREARPWLGEIGHGTARTEAVRQVAAYRAVYDVATDDPLGPRPQPRTRQDHAWSAAHRAIRSSHTTAKASGAHRLLVQLESVPTAHDDRPAADSRGPARSL
nr:AAA family ATPase [Microlunatus endophyticus]